MTATPEIVLGPPGTGKTTSLLSEVDGELARGTPPERVGYVSFTKRAASEAVTRACERFGLERDRLPLFRTLHSMCFQQIGARSGDMLEGKLLQEFAEYAGVRITGRFSEDGTMTGFDRGDRMMFAENLARIRCEPLRHLYDRDDDGMSWTELDRFSRALAQFKQDRGVVDYTDLLSQFCELDRGPELDVLFVDESQDLSQLQWRVVGRLAAGARRLVIAGDDDQAIYRWAGADPEHLIGMRGAARVLGQSWRVPRAVQAVAARVLSVVKHRRPKEWQPRDEEGAVDRASSFARADADGPDVLILARNAYILHQQVMPELRRRGVVYEYQGHPSIRAGVLDAIVSWEKLRRGETVSAAEARVAYEQMTVGEGVRRGHKKLPNFADEDQVNLQLLEERGGLLTRAIWHDALDRVPLSERAYIVSALRRGTRLRARPSVRVSTIHGSKGGEADHVILLKEMAWRTHREMRENPEDEARVWYVGATRARQRLTIVESSTAQRCPWL